MTHRLIAIILTAIMTLPTIAREVKLTLIETTDVHGNFLPYDFIKRQHGEGSMARVATFVDSVRLAAGPDNVILLDNGDILQGQPSAYYYNFIDTAATHIASDVYRFMRYDASTLGNHDVETGHAVYDRFVASNPIPILGANIIDTATGEPYLKPYTIINRGGIKIAVLGLITPAIPAWLPENLWSGLRFDDMVESARKWEKIIRERENPDLMVGLFHAGRDYTRTTDGMMENASLYIGRNVPGFDIIFFGHDHMVYNQPATNAGGTTLMLNPANNARNVAVAEVTFNIDDQGKATLIDKEGYIVSINHLEPHPQFMEQFADQQAKISAFVDREIGTSTATMSTQDAYFGPSTFMQLVHELQQSIGDADISLAAPLSFDARILEGPLHVSDMFTLYKYENLLYTMRLTGREIKDYLEMAYSLWTQQVDLNNPDAHLLNFAEQNPTPQTNRLKNPSYNFDSAYGIDYSVDVTKPQGEKITITAMSDGTPFLLDKTYTVAVNSYRANGGGDLMTVGAGIPRSELGSRLVKATDHDLRFYLLREIEKRQVIDPQLRPNWQFLPAEPLKPIISRDRDILFGPGASKEQK